MINILYNFIRKKFSPKRRQTIRKLFVNIFHPIFNYTLDELSDYYGSDKNYKHGYTKYYQYHFNSIKDKKIKLLEIGIGGYGNLDLGGASLRMWKKYFKKGMIYGIDIIDKTALDEPRIKTFICNQTDKLGLYKIMSKLKKIDVIIDDGSHINNDVINTFKLLFPYVRKGGFYAIEDVHTSYRDGYGGDSKNLNNNNTTMNYFKKYSDLVNKDFIENSIIENKFLGQDIKSIHFYRSLIIIEK